MGIKFDAFNRNSDYSAMLTGKVLRHFENAFRIKMVTKTVTRVVDGKEKQVQENFPVVDVASRKWVVEVLEVFADKMDITFGQAVQSFKTGNIDALQRVFARRANRDPVVIVRMETGYDKITGDKHASDMAFLASNHFADRVRESWGFALGIRHPGDAVPREFSATIATAVGAKPVVSKLAERAAKLPDFKGKPYHAA